MSEKKKMGRPNLNERKTAALESIAASLRMLSAYLEYPGIPVDIQNSDKNHNPINVKRA